jgi:hypothetical protein
MQFLASVWIFYCRLDTAADDKYIGSNLIIEIFGFKPWRASGGRVYDPPEAQFFNGINYARTVQGEQYEADDNLFRGYYRICYH